MSVPHRGRMAAALIACVAWPAALPTALPAATQEPVGAHPRPAPGSIGVPESIRIEHEEIHHELERATEAPGRVGEAARELAGILHPHFVREEQIALPPLGLLEPLARGELTPAMLGVLPMTDSLRAELPQMLREHQAIGAAVTRLEKVAREEGNASVAEFARRLRLHARSEEEVLYPAAILVGDIVRARAANRR